MKTNLLRIARRRFCSDLVSDSINRANRRKWVASVRRLGSKWVAIPNLQRERAHQS